VSARDVFSRDGASTGSHRFVEVGTTEGRRTAEGSPPFANRGVVVQIGIGVEGRRGDIG